MYQMWKIIIYINGNWSVPDVNECHTNNGDCSHECINTHGSYECVCPKGYRVHSDQKTCIGIFTL